MSGLAQVSVLIGALSADEARAALRMVACTPEVSAAEALWHGLAHALGAPITESERRVTWAAVEARTR